MNNPNGATRDSALPPVSVIMAVYNGERYIAEAIESILSQTHPHFEFIIVDDGSTDQTKQIIDRYAAHDQRIKVISQTNRGQAASLNRALTLAINEWVAILDYDDVSLPQRLERQLLALRANPTIRVLGSYAIEIDLQGREVGRLTTGPTSIAHFESLKQENRLVVLVHPSVILHRSTILAVDGYPVIPRAIDLGLWSRVADEHLILALPEPLVCYRVHAESMSSRRFFEGRLMLRWLQARQYARRHGLPEPSLGDYLNEERRLSHLHRLNQLRSDWTYYLSRRAWLAWIVGRRLEALILLAGASALDPCNVTKRLRERMRRHRRSTSSSDRST